MQCMCLCLPTLAENRELLFKKGVDIAELRVDFLDTLPQPQVLIRFARMSPLPLIFSWRLLRDGGLYPDNPEERKAYLIKMIKSEAFAYIDLEHDFDDAEVLDLIAQQEDLELISSYYDQTGIPEDLEARYERIVARGAIPKFACMIKSTADLLKLYRFSQGKRGLFIGMGHYGIPSRLLHRRFSSLWNYLIPEGSPLAPGQFSLKDLERCGLDGPRKKTSELFGVVGNPLIETELSKIHNVLFKKRSKIGVYIPFPADDFASFMELADELGLLGLSITAPFKADAIAYAKHVDELVTKLNSCNTLVRTKNEPWSAYNTEHDSFAQALKGKSYKKVLILGSGAAARMALFALKNIAEEKVYIASRTGSESLVDAEGVARIPAEYESRLEHIAWADRINYAKEADLVINTVPLSTERANHLADVRWGASQTVFDFVYFANRCTPLCQSAQDDGATVIEGNVLLQEQAQLQHLLFVDAIKRDRE